MTEDLNSNLCKFDGCNDFVRCSQCRQSWSSLRPQIEYYCSVVSIPVSPLGRPKFELSMESKLYYYYCSFPQFLQANAVIVP
jgi:hypothetical protein